jgi:ABC-type multidrug transport system ATPase subunit
MNKIVLEVSDLRKSYGEKEIIKGISFQLEKGEICGLVGNNGEGKTTLMRTLLGLMKQSEGEISWHREKNYIGYMPQTCKFNDKQTVEQTLEFFSDLRDCPKQNALDLCKKFNLDTNKKVKILSPGQQKKLQLIIATIGTPEMYILDEPTSGLDPAGTLEVLHMIKELNNQGNTIMISSHILQDLNEICTKVLILKDGIINSNDKVKEVICIRVGKFSKEQYEQVTSKYNAKHDIENGVFELDEDNKRVPDIIRDFISLGLDIYEVSYGNLRNMVLNVLDN